MTWWSVVPAILVAGCLLFLPGLLVLVAAGRWSLRTVALAPAVSVGLISVGAVAGSLVGLDWAWWVPMGLAVVVAGVAAVLRVVAGRGADPAPRIDRARLVYGAGALVGVLAGAVLIGRRLIAAMGVPDSISQTFDNSFHLNAVRYILDTGSGSTIDLGGMTGLSYYPGAWHDVVSLVVQITGVSIPVAVNATTLVVAAVVWPLSCVYLTAVLFPWRVWVLPVAGVLSSAFGSFPLLLLSFGVLYPNSLAIALLPAALAVTAQILGVPPRRDGAGRRTVLPFLLALAVALAGIALAHPNGMMAWLALSWPFLLWWAWNRASASWEAGSAERRRALAVVAGSLLGAGLATAVLWRFVRPPEVAATWAPLQSPAQALGEAVAGAHLGRPVSWIVAGLIVAGLIVAVRRPSRLWVCGPFLVTAFLFVVASGMPISDTRWWITGVWYNDPYRVAALLPVGSLIVAVLGATGVVVAARHVTSKALGALDAGPRARRVVPVALAVVGSLVLLVGSQGDNVRQLGREGEWVFTMSEDAPLLSRDEAALISRLPQTTPADAVIVTNPWTGAGLAYALAGREVTEEHVLMEVPDDVLTLDASLAEIDTDPDVCAAVRSSGADFVLDFGTRFVNNGDSMVIDYSGLEDLRAGEHLRLVDSEGKARLYQIVGCG